MSNVTKITILEALVRSPRTTARAQLRLSALSQPEYLYYSTHIIVSVFPNGNVNTAQTCAAVVPTSEGTAAPSGAPTLSPNRFAQLPAINFCSPYAQSDKTVGYYLNMDSTSAQDLAEEPNALTAVLYKREGSPDCSLCPSGSYVSTNCTTGSDRLCSPCTACSAGKFTGDLCSAYADATCQVCSSCSVGKYASTPCGSNADPVTGASRQDAVCSACSQCDYLHYVLQVCTAVTDTLCGTCMVCNFQSESVRKLCVSTPAYLSWAQANCCKNTKGITVPCSQLDWSNMQISGLDDRHQWAFSKTSPQLDSRYQTGQYKLGKAY
jgi:TNFR/NGFR cysteine-rich region